MINYTKKDHEFHGIFKLVSGEEILAKAMITEDQWRMSCVYTRSCMRSCGH